MAFHPGPNWKRDKGFTLVEALAALAIFAVAVLIAAAFLQAHANAARRLQARAALLRASETALEEVRGGVRPLASANFDSAAGSGLPPGAGVMTSVKIEGAGVPDLYRVRVTTRSAAAGEPMEVTLESLVWRP